MNDNYQLYYCEDAKGRYPALDYVESLTKKDKAKVKKYLDFLWKKEGKLSEPFSRHIKDELWELRVDFARNRHRIFYFIFFGKKIILLCGFQKHSQKTPLEEIIKAERILNYFKKYQFLLNYA